METLKESLTILLGHRITVYTDHENITFENFTTEIVLFWRLMLEEYGPEIKYIKGPDNYAADAFSRLQLLKYDVTESNIPWEQFAESYGVNQLDGDTFPPTYQTINTYQRKDKNLSQPLGQYCATEYHPPRILRLPWNWPGSRLD